MFARFLEATEIIDWNNPKVRAKANDLSAGVCNSVQTTQRCFEWVRDNIQHSSDFRRNPVTCTASEVLAHGTGYCYAKSHLLAALLRANAVPVGFCYQRLSINDQGAPFSLHGFNAVHLSAYGWYKVDARGNRNGIDAQFCPPVERLAFRLKLPEERTYPEILPAPHPTVIEALRRFDRWDELLRNLPDWELPILTEGYQA